MTWYSLDDQKNPVPVDSPDMEDKDRIVQQDDLGNGYWVSTVFLMLDHGFGQDGPPVLFETMVFPDDDSFLERECQRYCTWDEAVQGHKEMVEKWKDK